MKTIATPDMLPLESFITEYKDINMGNKYRPVAVGKYGIRTRESIYSKELAKDYSKNKLIYKNTLTVGMGSVQIDIGVLSDDVIYSVSPAYHTYKIKGINSLYLRYCLQCRNSDMFNRFAKRGSRQGKTIDLKRWLKYEIPVYDIKTQEEIVCRLEKVLNLIELRKHQLQQLDELVKSRFVEMFGDPTDIRLDRVPLAEYVENTKYGTSQPPQFDENGCFKFIRATNIKNGHIIEKNMLFISKAESEKISKCKLNSGELIIVRSGANTGDTCIITDEYTGQYAGYDIIVTLKTDKLNPVFLNELINIPQYMKKVVKPLTARSAQPHLNTQQVQGLPILVVDIDKQNEFANFVKQVDKSKFCVTNHLKKIQLIKGELL